MPHFQIKQSSNLTLTSHAGLALIGQCFEAAQVEAVIDPKLPVSKGIKTSDVVKSMVSLLCIGKSDYEAIEPFRDDRFFKRALNLPKVPSSVWLRQRIDCVAADLRETTDEMSMRLLSRTGAPITPDGRFVCCDIDVFAMDNSGTKKEEVSRTYQGFDGYAPIAAYLGNEGWNISLELRPGKQHSAKETTHFLDRVFPKVARLVAPQHAILHRADSGFDSVELLFQYEHERERLAKLDRQMDYIVKWNPRREDREAWVARASAEDAFKEVRPGKICAMLDTKIVRQFKKEQRQLRLITQVTLRTHDKKGQYLLEPEIELEGWWTSMEDTPVTVIKYYQRHGTHEQFHSEFKTDLDLERLPSGKFDSNDAILHLAMFAYNCLRLLGQLGLTGEISPVRHPAKRRRLKTVLQEIMHRAAKYVDHARYHILDFGCTATVHSQIIAALQARLWEAGST